MPIVPAAILFDLGVGDPLAVPDADAGYAATLAAEGNDGRLEGRIGAGTGATVAKLAGPERAKPGGVGSAARRLPDGSTVGALVVNNALGDVHARDGKPLVRAAGTPQPPAAGNTTLVVVATDANLDRAQCRKLAELGHDALAIGHPPDPHDVRRRRRVRHEHRRRIAARPRRRSPCSEVAAIDAAGEAIERSVA